MQSKEDIKSIINLLKFASLKEKEGSSVQLDGLSCKTLYEYIEQLETEKQKLKEKLEETVNTKNVLVETTKLQEILQEILHKDTIGEIKKVIAKIVNEYRKEILKIVQGENDDRKNKKEDKKI